MSKSSKFLSFINFFINEEDMYKSLILSSIKTSEFFILSLCLLYVSNTLSILLILLILKINLLVSF